MDAFKLAINMPGAISAGAYTAGVLDFLVQAIDEWERAKATGAPVPRHRISIECLSGASAGGMCAAIAAVQLNEQFPHVTSAVTPDTTITGNRLYDSWVQRIRISRLLESADLQKNPILVSVLDCTVLDEIATAAIQPPSSSAGRTYISPSLTLLLTLTNLRGTYYPLYFNDSKSAEEFTCYFGDRIRFQYGSTTACSDGTPVEPLAANGQGSWPLLRDAALATGAFPVALAPRVVQRRLSDYLDKSWNTQGSNSGVPPDFGGLVSDNGTLATLNVDGGVTNNDPFALAHDFLANLEPRAPNGKNPREADRADRAVLSIAPFPTVETFSDRFSKPSSLLAVASRVLDALIAQSRFQGESLGLLMSRDGFSRFVIAPKDDRNPGATALQSSALGAFGGFFSKGFRDHDFLLGRRNCQKFLSSHLVLRSDNPIIAAGLTGLTREQITAASVAPPLDDEPLPPDVCWIPLIPLWGETNVEVPYPQPSVMPYSELTAIGDAARGRLRAAAGALIEQATSGFKAWLYKTLLNLVLLFISAKKIADGLAGALGTSVESPH
jgi:hypothetical protein